MSEQLSDFPVLFTVESSNRHESEPAQPAIKPGISLTVQPNLTVILVNAGLDLQQLKQAIEAVAESPNCAEVLSKYRSKELADSVSEIKVKWAERQLFPKETLVTEDNVRPVLTMLSNGAGKDVLNVKIVQKAGEAPKK